MDDTIFMAKQLELLEGKNVGVIGFNARPIAASLKRQGAQTFVSDYWGDLDLASVSTEYITILSPIAGVRQRQPLDIPLCEVLVENFEILTQDKNLDYVIIGSGFDDRSETLWPSVGTGNRLLLWLKEKILQHQHPSNRL